MTIELISIKGVKAEFSYEHALTLLRKFKTWSIPEDSEYKFSNNDIIRRKKRRRNSEEESTQGTSGGGEISS